ncbi:MAG: tripartite tricarboxylate transporter TctB family protein, partial [Pseudomonadota bacterium]
LGGYLQRHGFLSTVFLIDLALLILAVCFFVMASDYPDMARTFPSIVLTMIGIFTILDMLYVLRAEKAKQSTGEASEGTQGVHSGRATKVLYMAALMFVFYLLLASVGLILGTLIFLLLSGWTLGYKKPKMLIFSSVIITVFIYLIFQVIMESILPDVLLLELIGG